MADTLPPEFLEALTKATRGLNDLDRQNQLLIRSYKAMPYDRYLDGLKQVTKSIKFLSGDSLVKFTRGIKDGFSGLDDFKQTIDTLNEVIDSTADSTEKSRLQQERDVMVRRASMVAITAATADFTKALSKTVVVGMAATAGQFAQKLQNNASATDLSTSVLSGALDIATSATGAAGKGMQSVGATMMTMGTPQVKAFGAALSLAGGVVSTFSESFNKLAKFSIEVLSKEVEKTVTAFNNMSRSGAMFADGMSGMRAAALQSGLSLEQFSKVVTENASTLAASGMGVGEATRRMGQVSKQFTDITGTSGKKLREEMLQLGFSFEDQAGLVAEVMGDLRRSRGKSLGDDKAIAEQTATYASNLRLISAVTGEDAKRKMEEARAASTQVAFRLKLQELEQKQPGITNAVLTSMSTMNETNKKAVMQQMTLGTVTDKSASIMMSGSEAYSEQILGFSNLVESGQFSAEKALELQGRTNDAMQKDLANFREIGIAGLTGGLQDLNTAISGQIASMDKISLDAVKNSEVALQKQKETNDKLTAGLMSAANAAQNLKVALEEQLSKYIPEYAKTTSEVLKGIEKMIKESGIGKESFWDKTKRIGQAALSAGAVGGLGGYAIGSKIGAVTGGVAGGVAGAGIGAAPGAAAGGLGGGAIGAIIGGIGGAIAGGVKEAFFSEPGKALGGISEGPMSGYLEKLHGSEAVIPLDGGRSVPVSLNIGNLANSLAEAMPTKIQTGMAPGVMAAGTSSAGLPGNQLAVDLTEKQITILNDILDVLAESNRLQQQYVNNTAA